MPNFNFNFSVPAQSQQAAGQKVAALAKLAENFDEKTLSALADRAPSLMSGPFAGMIKQQLGI